MEAAADGRRAPALTVICGDIQAAKGKKLIIRLTGNAHVSDRAGNGLTDCVIQQLNGAESQQVCSDYFDTELADLGITSGTVKLVHDIAVGAFRVVTEFRSPTVLQSHQLKRLVSDTLGQWSDGIGEGCFDELEDRLNVCIDLASNRENDVRVEQIDDGYVVPRLHHELAKAAREGDLQTLIHLLGEGADTEVRVQGYTPLHLAVLGGHANVVLELIRRSADVRARDAKGADALMLTALSNRIVDADAARIAEALLGRGVDAKGPRDGYTPLFMAENRKKTKLVAVLRQAGAEL